MESLVRFGISLCSPQFNDLPDVLAKCLQSVEELMQIKAVVEKV